MTFRTVIAVSLAVWLVAPQPRPHRVHFVFTSDAHFGITRAAFRGGTNVDAAIVNRAMIARINELPAARFPADDGGVGAGEPIGAIDFVAQGGDIANRAEATVAGTIQPSAASWRQFQAGYIDGLQLRDANDRPSPLFFVAGNHDASNAVGFFSPITPAADKTAMVEIFNRMMRPHTPRTPATFDYTADRVTYASEYGGVRFIYTGVWLDSRARAWADHDLGTVSPSTPVIIVTHDPPDADSRHFINPNGNHGVNRQDGFANLLSDQFADGRSPDAPAISARRDLETFFGRHPNIVAWFHGHTNVNEFYTWRGPGGTASLKVFRVDSPMKGRLSAADERKLSFHVAAIDSATKTMTVRECLWNADPAHPDAPVTWGSSSTVSLEKK